MTPQQSEPGADHGRVAIVTGAGRGVGRGEALHLAARGFSVLVNDLDPRATAGSTDAGRPGGAADAVVAEIRSAGGTAAADNHDVASRAGAERLITAAVDAFGRVDVLVNNAGILRSEPFTDMPVETFDEVLRVCLHGHIEPSRALARWWAQQGTDKQARRIVNTSSLAGIYGPNFKSAAYATAKAGVIGLTLALARELAELDATVNAIAPRAVTQMTEANAKYEDSQVRERFAPEQVAPLVGWLASKRSRSLTGRLFIVGGGQVFLVRPYETFGPYSLLDSSEEHDLPVGCADWSIEETAMVTWAELEARFR
jgi:NAD(P)-dependent dehydrogenase (short-subunit alcohol dehydrogenase family)